jgi:hemerythrin
MLIKGMKDYTVEHFTTEKMYMKRHNFTDYASHKKEHDAFVAKVSEVERRFNRGRVSHFYSNY